MSTEKRDRPVLNSSASSTPGAARALRLPDVPQEHVRGDTAELRARLGLLAHDGHSTISASGSGGAPQMRADSSTVARLAAGLSKE
jgi:hypothetical protein